MWLFGSIACTVRPRFVVKCREPNMELLFLEAKPIPSHAITALLGSDYRRHSARSAKGTRQHQLLGYLWVSMMMYVSISSFFISEIQLWGPSVPIHLLSAWTVFTLCTVSTLRALATSKPINGTWFCSTYWHYFLRAIYASAQSRDGADAVRRLVKLAFKLLILVVTVTIGEALDSFAVHDSCRLRKPRGFRSGCPYESTPSSKHSAQFHRCCRALGSSPVRCVPLQSLRPVWLGRPHVVARWCEDLSTHGFLKRRSLL